MRLQKWLHASIVLKVYSSADQEKFRVNENIVKHCGLFLAVAYAVADPLEQRVQHEPVTE